MQHYSHDATVDRVMTERSMFGMSTKSRSHGQDSKSSFLTNDTADVFSKLSTLENSTSNYYEIKEPTRKNLLLLPHICNDFNFNFLNQFTQKIKNRKSIIISPFSMIQLFIMLYVTAKGRSETDLQKYFSFPDKGSTFKSLVQLNIDLEKTNIFTNSNVICIPDTANLNDKYFKLLSNVGHIIHYNYDAADKCVKYVNDIAASTTNGMINNVINENMIKFPTKVVLINIIYFYSKWKSQFDPNLTKQETFYGNTIKANMMMQRDGRFNYFEDNINQVLEMDYDDGFFTMGFILPHKMTGDINLNNAQVEHYVQRLVPTEINILKIPKFVHEFKYKVDNIFRENGLDSLFRKLETELVNVPVEISYIIHGAVIMVDENGTKVAAHTSMVISQISFPPSEPKKINFIANHPFSYYIRYKQQNIIVFTGQYF